MPIHVFFRLTFHHGGHAHVKGPEWSNMSIFGPFLAFVATFGRGKRQLPDGKRVS